MLSIKMAVAKSLITTQADSRQVYLYVNQVIKCIAKILVLTPRMVCKMDSVDAQFIQVSLPINFEKKVL